MTRHTAFRGFRALAWSLALVAWHLAFSVTLLGQEMTGVIYGRVTDSQGHPQQLLVHLIADGEIPVGSVYTDTEGQYSFTALPGGEYWLVVEAEGFQPVRQHVRLDTRISAEMQVNIALEKAEAHATPPSPVIAGSAASHTVDAKNPVPSFDPRALREFDKGNAQRKKGNVQAAIGHYEKAVRIDPRLYPALNNLGTAYERLGAHRQAEQVLLKALEINPNDGESYVNLGHVLYEEGRYAEARARLEEAVKRSPISATGLFFLGSTELKLGDLGSAELNLKQACKLDPNGMPAAHLQLANVYLREHDRAAAGRELESYLRANPNDPQAPAIRKLLVSIQVQKN